MKKVGLEQTIALLKAAEDNLAEAERKLNEVDLPKAIEVLGRCKKLTEKNKEIKDALFRKKAIMMFELAKVFQTVCCSLSPDESSTFLIRDCKVNFSGLPSVTQDGKSSYAEGIRKDISLASLLEVHGIFWDCCNHVVSVVQKHVERIASDGALDGELERYKSISHQISEIAKHS